MDGEILDAGAVEEPVIDAVETDPAEVETEVPESPAETPEGEAPEGEGEQQPKPDLTDPKVLDKEAEKLLKDMRRDPEKGKLAQRINDRYYRSLAYEKHGTVQEVAQMAATIATYGGAEGLEQMKAETAEYADALTAFDSGDPKAIEKYATEAPEGFKKFVPKALSKLFEISPEIYRSTIAAPILNTLKNYLNSSNGDHKAAVESLLRDAEEQLQRTPQDRGPNPEAEKIRTDREQLNNEKASIHIGNVGDETANYQKTLVSKELASFVKGRNIGKEAQQGLLQDLLGDGEGINKGEIFRQLRQDESYQTQVKASLQKIKADVAAGRDVSEQKRRLTNFVKAKLDEVIPKAARRIWNVRYSGVPTKAAARPGVKANGPSGSFMQPGEKPIHVDGWDTLWIAGKAYVERNGKQVLVNRPTKRV